MALSIVLTIGSCSLVLWAFQGGYRRGVKVAVFFLILLPKTVFLVSEQLSAHRLIILIVLLYNLINRGFFENRRRRDLLAILAVIGVFKLLSAILGIDKASSFKRMTAYLLEIVFYCAVLLDACRSRKDVESYLRSIFAALAVVSIFGLLEKYAGLVVLSYLPRASGGLFGLAESVSRTRGVKSTYLHPILFGTAMSMGWPLGFYFLWKERNRSRIIVLWILVFTMFANVYFSVSRGAWLSSIAILGALMLLWRNRGRRQLGVIMVLVVAVLAANSGVYQTISSLYRSTFNYDSIEGASFVYRFELWKQAYYQVSKSFQTLLFGYGEDARKVLDMAEGISVTGHMLRFLSWDSEYAVLLLETGFIGLGLNAFLYLYVLGILTRRWWTSRDADRALLSVFMVIVLMFNMMMITVKIFAVQLWFILWAVICMGYLVGDGSAAGKPLAESLAEPLSKSKP